MTGEETVAVNVILPYSLKGRESDVTIALRDGAIDVHYPRLQAQKTADTQASRAPSITDKAIVLDTEANNAEAEKLDENYLSGLVKKQEKLAIEKHAQDDTTQAGAGEGTDRVNLTQSSVAKSANTAEKTAKTEEGNTQSRFSVAGYIGKFVAFLAIMIAGFYGVLTLFKKGIIKKGKLGFLNSTKMVEVLSTTHIAPKRTLMMVKAHKQVFLISSSETGVQFLSEINDVAGLIKNGEEEITGSNFDTNLNSANKTEKEFKLKEKGILQIHF
jgi:flagellar biogenesis protein FliO